MSYRKLVLLARSASRLRNKVPKAEGDMTEKVWEPLCALREHPSEREVELCEAERGCVIGRQYAG